jgi:hypothetical protein
MCTEPFSGLCDISHRILVMEIKPCSNCCLQAHFIAFQLQELNCLFSRWPHSQSDFHALNLVCVCDVAHVRRATPSLRASFCR